MKAYRPLFFLAIGSLSLFHLWYIGSGALDLAPDEAHYWEWSRHLDWSYYSKGPMVAYLIRASTSLGGESEFFVRLPAVLLAAGTAILVYLLAKALFSSERVAFFSVLLLSLIPLYAAGSILMTIDAPFVFFWALALFALQKAVRSQSSSPSPPRGEGRSEGASRWWVLFGVALGLGMLSKYTMALLLPSLLLYLSLSPGGRLYLRRKEPCLAMVVSLLLFSPVVLWNARHDWVSLRHVLGQAGLGGGGTLSMRTFLEFLGSQAGVVSPFLFLALLLGMGRSALLWQKKRREEHLFLFCFSAPILGFFLLWSFYEKIQANWAAPSYLTASIALAAWGNELKRAAVIATLVLALVPAIVLILVGHFPALLDRVGVNLPPKADPTRRLQGWKELGEAVSGILQEMEREQPAFIMSDRYQITSELAFYVEGKPRTYNINLGRRMNQYDLWDGIEALRGQDAVFVTYDDREAPPELQAAFDSVTKDRTLWTFHRNRPAQVFSIFRCDNFKGGPLGKGRVSY